MAHFEKKCLSILLNNSCNLKCRYCYCDDGDVGESIDLEFVKQAILDFKKQGNEMFIRFFGDGEPTLELDKIKKIVEFSKEVDKESKFELQTNGFFSDDYCKWISENINIVWISYDGTTEINNFYRPTKSGAKSSGIVEKNIRNLTKRVESVGVRTTIGKKNLFRQKEIIDKMIELGIRYIYSDLMFACVGTHEYFEDEINPMIYAKEYLDAYYYAKEKGVFYGSVFMINFDKKSNIFCRSCLPMPHLTTDGYISCCDMAYNGKIMPELIYGKYDQETKKIIYQEEKIQNIKNRTVDNISECRECSIKYYCGGGCVGEAVNENGCMNSIKKKNCEAIKYLATKLVGCEIPILHP